MMSETIPSTMKALVKREEKESYVLQDIPVPEPEGDEALLKVQSVSICGSDISLYKWNEMAKVIATIPFIPGHECAGVVVKAGPQCLLPLGTKVGVENHFYCGECYQCTHGERDICQKLSQYGHGRGTFHGGCSQYSIVSSKYLYPLKTNITPEETVLLEPLGVAHNAIERLAVTGEDVLVLGCGPVGLLAIGVAKALGATRVIGADIDESRLELAKTLGADIIIQSSKEDIKKRIEELTGGDGVGRIAECTGAAPIISSMFTYLRKGGHVVMVGLPKQPVHVEDPLPNIVFKGLTLKTVHGRRVFHTWEETERLTAEKKVNSLAVISHRIPMSRFEEAFEVLFSGKSCKIVLDPHN